MKTPDQQPQARIYFTDFFDVSPDILEKYGAFNVACIVDLPLFIDPFLLFTSRKSEYQNLHQEIIRYLCFLRDKSLAGSIDEGLLEAWYCFPEVSQNKLGFCLTGSSGRGLGLGFARALNENLHDLFSDFGKEKVTKGSHLEKLVLIRERVGRDNISDFTTNLIKGYLLEYTQAFAKKHIAPEKLKRVSVPRVQFDYEIGVWTDAIFELPWFNGDYVLLTPENILTKDDTWINKEDLRRDFPTIKESISNHALRAQIDAYFRSVLPKKPTIKDEREAIEKTLRKFKELIDYYIREKENNGDEAIKRSADKVQEVNNRFIQNISYLVGLIAKHSLFYQTPGNTLTETFRKIEFLKQVIENQDGYKLFYVKGKPVERETDLHILFKLVWEGSPSSVDAEVNNGRGPVDFGKICAVRTTRHWLNSNFTSNSIGLSATLKTKLQFTKKPTKQHNPTKLSCFSHHKKQLKSRKCCCV